MSRESESESVPDPGLGDRVESVIKKVTGGRIKPCSKCKKRKEWLNRHFPAKNEESTPHTNSPGLSRRITRLKKREQGR